jgi:hypothetical protein
MNKTLKSLLALASLIESDPPSETTAPAVSYDMDGQHIAVLDRGFIYVGNVSREGEFLKLTHAKNLRRWGTTKGLGELVNGPLENTVTDPVGEVLIPFKALIHLIPCKGF